jgi:RimJ/RimL family protein N-acetyltransferase
VQRTALNTEAKLLLLAHAFEKTGIASPSSSAPTSSTSRPREAIARLGAKQDGVLRHHQVLPDGSLRDTVVFSIIAPEWPAVKKNLVWAV